MPMKILNDDSRGIEVASKIIERGGLVAFPTETVYGVGCDVFNEEAVKKVYEIKKRDFSKPLIVGVSEVEQIYELAEVNEVAEKLIKKFFPGPLTLILKRKEIVPKIVTSGLEKVAIRMPDHFVPLELMKRSGKPIVVPSANVSGKPSPTKFEHVIQDLPGIDAVIKGECKIGIESTIVDVTTDPIKILRFGAVPKREIERHTKLDVELSFGEYKTSKPFYLFIGERVREGILKFVSDAESKGLKPLIIAKEDVYGKEVITVGKGKDYVRNIFDAIRRAELMDFDLVILEGFDDPEYGDAVMHRLKMLAGERVIRV